VSHPRGSQELGTLERRLWRLITEPEGVAAALVAEGDASGSGLRALVRGDRGLAAQDRLAVYANAYFVRIHDCLRSDFGALARAIGPGAFHDLVKTYLMAHPPSQPSLRYAGKDLAAFLETEPFAELFGRRCAYAADLARLEWALNDAFDARDADLLLREALASIPSDAWAELRFRTIPALEVLSLSWPVHTVRERFDQGCENETWDAPPPLEPAQTYVRVWRRDECVHYRGISGLEAETLKAAQRGEAFGVLCERVAQEVGESTAAVHAVGLLEAWVAAGLLSALA